ncbi:hypothetical protein [Asanoa siamensis]|uniref:Transcriptional regulator n=1 Tax=Asanoa siamensis TaxID=926357 RepID=A0ABQ4CIE1_9ACTN|nr:hypothetical protein [Asanoa siamensis]GIF71021.1 hypothetical protein Asi02nite_05390 [Asanoa siamensis]
MLVATVGCRVCANGLIVFTVGSGLFLECVECLTGYRDPADLTASFRVEDLREPTRPATAAEVANRGWAAYLDRRS